MHYGERIEELWKLAQWAASAREDTRNRKRFRQLTPELSHANGMARGLLFRAFRQFSIDEVMSWRERAWLDVNGCGGVCATMLSEWCKIQAHSLNTLEIINCQAWL